MDLLVAVQVAHAYARRNMVEANVKKVGQILFLNRSQYFDFML